MVTKIIQIAKLSTVVRQAQTGWITDNIFGVYYKSDTYAYSQRPLGLEIEKFEAHLKKLEEEAA